MPFKIIKILAKNNTYCYSWLFFVLYRKIYIAGSSSIQLKKPGVYLISVDAVAAESGTAGTVTMQLQKNGVNVEGATSSSNSAAVTDFNGMSFSTVIKVLPSCASIDNTTTLTVLNTGVGAIYSNTNITVVKLC